MQLKLFLSKLGDDLGSNVTTGRKIQAEDSSGFVISLQLFTVSQESGSLTRGHRGDMHVQASKQTGGSGVTESPCGHGSPYFLLKK